MKKVLSLLMAVMALTGSVFGATIEEKIAQKYKVIKKDVWYGYDRIIFNFEGNNAWVVLPKVEAKKEMPWTWTIQWAEAFVPRTGVLDLLAEGWHHATIDSFKYRMNEKGLALSSKFQDFLVNELGFNKKVSLVGMSWGGFFSIRYTNRNPDRVNAIYLDAPLLTFADFANTKKFDSHEKLKNRIGPWADDKPEDGNWNTDPRMPVNMAGSIAKAKIPVMLLYGGKDVVVNPQENCETFLKRFKEANGNLYYVENRKDFGHHPHGLETNETYKIAAFFKKMRGEGEKVVRTVKLDEENNDRFFKISDYPLACENVEVIKNESPSMLPSGRKLKLSWNDEFNGDKLDTSKWSYRTNFWGQRAHWFAAPEDNAVEVKDGKAFLKLVKLPNGQFVSPQLQTGELLWDNVEVKNRKVFWPFAKREKPKFLQKYGYYECRCRLQQLPGWWSAFWMQTEAQGTTLDPRVSGIEHDIMESFAPGVVIPACFHYNGYGPDYKGFRIPDCPLKSLSNIKLDEKEYHTFGLLWEPTGYSVYVDGRLRGKSKAEDPVSQIPQFVLISTEAKWYRNDRMKGKGVPELEDAVKGNDAFIVDYVRVFTLED